MAVRIMKRFIEENVANITVQSMEIGVFEQGGVMGPVMHPPMSLRIVTR